MKYVIIYTALIASLVSCNQSNSNSTTQSNDSLSQTNNNETTISENHLSDDIIEQIKSYYRNFHFESAGVKGDNLKVTEKKSGNEIELSYDGKLEGSNEFSPLSSVNIPLKPKSQSSESYSPSFLFGDMNNDGAKDLVVKTYIEGAGAGSNTGWSDLFLFINNNGKLTLKAFSKGDKMFTKFPISELTEISNNQLIGTGYEYGPDDAECCPSLKYKYIVGLSNDKLHLIGETKIKE